MMILNSKGYSTQLQTLNDTVIYLYIILELTTGYSGNVAMTIEQAMRTKCVITNCPSRNG